MALVPTNGCEGVGREGSKDGLVDVVSVEFGVEKAGFVIREEVIVSIVVRTSCDTAKTLEGLTGVRR
jgi:hypothetical protein